jgi:hypothetical protein
MATLNGRFEKATLRIASLNSRGRMIANSQELSGLLSRKQIDILGAQEVKSHLPLRIQGYDWLPGLDRFIRPNDHVGIGFLVKKQIRGLVSIALVHKTHEFMWIKLAGRGNTQDTFICVTYCFIQRHPIVT